MCGRPLACIGIFCERQLDLYCFFGLCGYFYQLGLYGSFFSMQACNACCLLVLSLVCVNLDWWLLGHFTCGICCASAARLPRLIALSC